MPKYVAFLRAINLGAKRKFPKADIVTATEAAGGTDVETHINTGNVLLTTSLRSRAKVESALEAAYEEQAGFVVPTIVFTPAELVAIADDARELTGARPDLERHYVYLLKDEPDPALARAVEERSDAVNEVVVRGRAAHILLGPGYEAGGVDPYRVEKSLGVVATNRNFNVVTTLADKWCS
ncbi:hypothetical protein CFH99_07505 [Nocardioides aromaticivorans]|uniref:DUF1697 domain-containing protein n=1 Tax=Nocardioides aromaticivorans TaxID=200618 RepID=A0ABX7PI66_9ACTN|nr:DUF1697 domain-containing protein [Nocardioides aromaticivorans]QSR25470.1 hypothetical protein CFH99_07505 [Nocardioides aromaticivorans]